MVTLKLACDCTNLHNIIVLSAHMSLTSTIWNWLQPVSFTGKAMWSLTQACLQSEQVDLQCTILDEWNATAWMLWCCWSDFSKWAFQLAQQRALFLKVYHETCQFLALHEMNIKKWNQEELSQDRLGQEGVGSTVSAVPKWSHYPLVCARSFHLNYETSLLKHLSSSSSQKTVGANMLTKLMICYVCL